ncbi:MAG: hypothetical protein KDC18_06280 [Alphaproteobacteria bacterium]|nr:hypothetical protein [Alphaproteobacteria bacterium]MCB9929271.1 hypothetical protein [Alphaproteobacteria bacterium]
MDELHPDHVRQIRDTVNAFMEREVNPHMDAIEKSGDENLPSNRIAALAMVHASQTAKLVGDKAQQIFGGYGMALEYRVSWLKSYADLFFTGEGSANVQKIVIAEDALGYKVADRHHGRTGLRDPRRDDIADEMTAA